MVSQAFTYILSFIGWSFIPHRLTEYLLPYYFKFFVGSIPPRGSPPSNQAYKRVYTTVVALYLSYNLYQAAFNQPPNFYELLNVGPDADESQLKLAFRNFARKNHPDKVGRQGEELFMIVRDAYESLKHPVKRFAYDRFGAEALSWEHVTTLKEYLETGIWQGCGFYIGIGFMMVVHAFLGESDSGTVWRTILFVYVGFAELMLCVQSPPLQPETTASSLPIPEARSALTLPLAILRMFFPKWVPFQFVAFLHQVFITLTMAIARIGPVVFPDHNNTGAVEEKTWAMMISRIARASQVMEGEFNNGIKRELAAMRGPVEYHQDDQGRLVPNVREDDPSMEILSGELENVMIEAHLQSHPLLRSVWDRVVDLSRRTARAGIQAMSPAEPSPATVTSQLEEITQEGDTININERSDRPNSPTPNSPQSTIIDTASPSSPKHTNPLVFPPSTPSRLAEYTTLGMFERPGLSSRRSSQRLGSLSPVRTPGKIKVEPFDSPASGVPSQPIFNRFGTGPSWMRGETTSAAQE